MHIEIKQSPTHNSQSIHDKTDEQLNQIAKKYVKGCSKIFHKPGYMNVKGDGPYDFTCDGSHRCNACQNPLNAAYSQISRRSDQAQKKLNKKKTVEKKQTIRKKYFIGKPGCKCQKDSMCQECFKKLQADVTKYEQGCGKKWQQEFGGMAAGPAWVTCYNNYFLCDVCSQQLAFINTLNKQYPHVKMNHIPQQQKMFWAPRNYPYYSGNL